MPVRAVDHDALPQAGSGAGARRRRLFAGEPVHGQSVQLAEWQSVSDPRDGALSWDFRTSRTSHALFVRRAMLDARETAGSSVGNGSGTSTQEPLQASSRRSAAFPGRARQRIAGGGDEHPAAPAGPGGNRPAMPRWCRPGAWARRRSRRHCASWLGVAVCVPWTRRRRNSAR